MARIVSVESPSTSKEEQPWAVAKLIAGSAAWASPELAE